MIPGEAAPNPEAIHKWSAREMYQFCVRNNIPEVWAYLWENWYCQERWKLWARSPCPDKVPVLTTTMIAESHFQKIKHDFLHYFNHPRLDLLVHIISQRMLQQYYVDLHTFLEETGRYSKGNLSWRPDFKRKWRTLEKVPQSEPFNPKYKPDALTWTCTCPSMRYSQFLICKHLIQHVRPVPPKFFLGVKRH
ncbi:hypothetical protein BDV98DRAFT_515691 [Pterulicium gracile]|uniref:SWIM-type domain-containing protein n=1 Tax=Pterulicium gracile TaxID=1884261 RepID=A0A5C3Q4L3_9AGAR|nr:hypothetical protein BDV98DRAFT_515691 [Pterula gracilis]